MFIPLDHTPERDGMTDGNGLASTAVGIGEPCGRAVKKSK